MTLEGKLATSLSDRASASPKGPVLDAGAIQRAAILPALRDVAKDRYGEWKCSTSASRHRISPAASLASHRSPGVGGELPAQVTITTATVVTNSTQGLTNQPSSQVRRRRPLHGQSRTIAAERVERSPALCRICPNGIVRNALKLVIGNKNYSSWSMRHGWRCAPTTSPSRSFHSALYRGDADKQRILNFTHSGKVPA